jgi:hypothetical protein
MARFDELDRPGRSPAIPDRPSYRSAPGPARALAAPAGPAEPLLAMIRLGLLALLLACWVAGAYAGIVFWSFQGSLLGVIASALVPGLAATLTWSAFTALETPMDQR